MRAKKVKVPKLYHRVDMGIHAIAVRSDMGWCAYCAAFTKRDVPKDGCGYLCPYCDRHAVIGHSEAYSRGMYYF